MVPALGLVLLAWVMSCLVFTSAKLDQLDINCCSCQDLKPVAINDQIPILPQVMPSPFKIEINMKSYMGNNNENENIIVTLKATQGYTFQSFILGAYVYEPINIRSYRRDKDFSQVKGKLSLFKDQDEFEVRDECTKAEKLDDGYVTYNALASQDLTPKQDLRFIWSPVKNHGPIEFRATFVVNEKVYWVAEKSAILQDHYHPIDVIPPTYIPPINTDGCGTTKGCLREPAGCIEPHCIYILTWQGDNTNTLNIEMGGLADGSQDRYVAFALSQDTYMGGDTVYTCAHNSKTDRTEIFVSNNEDDPKRNIPMVKYEDDAVSVKFAKTSLYNFIVSEQGSYANNRLRCRFTVKRDLDVDFSNLLPFRGQAYHILFARGYAIRGSPQRHGLSVEELPISSSNRINFGDLGDFSGRAGYPLAKAHACLMILAWIFFASIGLLMTKYYKPMWPNSRIANERYWFIAHFNCMASMFIITIIGIILIFVEAGGYSEAPDLPQKAHPILGIIILVCIIINPVLALIRPAESSSCRPVFNWFHWAFGTIANVLAIPQIFIGMDFGKVMVPWWATWILVIWVIFHIAVELTLEIHQCCTHKKNKERKKKWEQLKREYPKQHHPEPEPAGRRFKRFMLFLHVGFTALITLIMIIIIAVS